MNLFDVAMDASIYSVHDQRTTFSCDDPVFHSLISLACFDIMEWSGYITWHKGEIYAAK